MTIEKQTLHAKNFESNEIKDRLDDAWLPEGLLTEAAKTCQDMRDNVNDFRIEHQNVFSSSTPEIQKALKEFDTQSKEYQKKADIKNKEMNFLEDAWYIAKNLTFSDEHDDLIKKTTQNIDTLENTHIETLDRLLQGALIKQELLDMRQKTLDPSKGLGDVDFADMQSLFSLANDATEEGILTEAQVKDILNPANALHDPLWIAFQEMHTGHGTEIELTKALIDNEAQYAWVLPEQLIDHINRQSFGTGYLSPDVLNAHKENFPQFNTASDQYDHKRLADIMRFLHRSDLTKNIVHFDRYEGLIKAEKAFETKQERQASDAQTKDLAYSLDQDQNKTTG